MAAWRGLTLARPHHNADEPFPELDGNSPALRTLKHHMLRVAQDGDVTVLILGESGTGKERIARAVHDHSPRAPGPFVVVNCAGLSPSLAEDELFGHVRGAFTGALHDRPGPFERAAGGTVFLDEIGDLSAELQMRLLRVLQERTVQRLGSPHESSVDVRVIAATNVDLERARAQGRFRDDLYFRLDVYALRVPPLRQRGAHDLAALAISIVRRLCERRRRASATIDPAVLALFGRYRWPGNVRELENNLERMVVAAGPAGVLTTEHLSEEFVARIRAASSGDGARDGLPAARRPSDDEVVEAMEASGLNRRRAAAALGLSRHQLYRRVRETPALAVRLARERGS